MAVFRGRQYSDRLHIFVTLSFLFFNGSCYDEPTLNIGYILLLYKVVILIKNKGNCPSSESVHFKSWIIFLIISTSISFHKRTRTVNELLTIFVLGFVILHGIKGLGQARYYLIKEVVQLRTGFKSLPQGFLIKAPLAHV